jgi:protein O-mannosyl-transferase
MSSLSSPRVQCLLLLLIVTCLFWPGLSGDFLFDDYPNIVTNAKIHATSLDAASLQRAASAYDQGGIPRPLPSMWFAVDHYFSGKDPWSYKFSGLLVHLCNTLLVLFLLRALLALPAAKLAPDMVSRAAFAVAMIWAIHPIQISTVLYIVQRMESLSLSFVLAALLCYLAGRRRQIEGVLAWPFLLACVPLLLLGLASKESALLFPVYALALELTLFTFSARDAATSHVWRWGYGVAVMLAVAAFVFWAVPHFAGDGAYAFRDFTVQERLLTQFRVLPMYLGQMLLPVPASMSFYYDALVVSKDWLVPATTLAGALLLAALLVTAWLLRRRVPLFALGICWFFAAHLLTSNVVALEHAFEHRNYFALLGVLLALLGMLAAGSDRLQSTAFRLFVPVLIVGLSGLTLLRAATWGDPFLLATELVANAPQSARAANDLATLYMGAAKADPASPYFVKAQQEFERASGLPGASPLPEQGLIMMYAVSGQPAPDAWWTRLTEKLQQRSIGPQETMSVTGLLRLRDTGVVLDDQKLRDACEALLSHSDQPLQVSIDCARNALVHLDDEVFAETVFRQALLRADSASAMQVINLLVAENRQRLAQSVMSRAVELGLIAPSNESVTPADPGAREGQ